ncbi:MAG TPA: DUF488 domain-containing protein [Chloroflexota bacterium]|nr:DUF488 domain-containing protein [Chloroflexota bacterium]
MESMLTLGHSNHDIGRFVELLGLHGVNRVVDVRSAPYSRYSPQFNRESLARSLADADIEYRFFGQELGGRPPEPECYDDASHVLYQRLEQTDRFRSGIEQVIEMADFGWRICLVCSEGNPTECHRFLSIGHHLLHNHSMDVRHIQPDGTIESQSEIVARQETGKPHQYSLFEEESPRRSLQPVSPPRAPGSSSVS